MSVSSGESSIDNAPCGPQARLMSSPVGETLLGADKAFGFGVHVFYRFCIYACRGRLRGPLHVKLGQLEGKQHEYIFVCTDLKAVHDNFASSQTTESLPQVFIDFYAIHGG